MIQEEINRAEEIERQLEENKIKQKTQYKAQIQQQLEERVSFVFMISL